MIHDVLETLTLVGSLLVAHWGRQENAERYYMSLLESAAMMDDLWCHWQLTQNEMYNGSLLISRNSSFQTI
jgi:hypothetical protein